MGRDTTVVVFEAVPHLFHEPITPEEIEALQNPDWTTVLRAMTSTQLATPITTAEMVMPALRPD